MSGPYRLPDTAPARFGSAIDRAEPVGFRYGGRALSGLYGDTAASALLAAGVSAFGRSPVLGRPRGLMAISPDDPCGRVAVDGETGSDAGLPPGEVTLGEGLALRAVDAADGLARALTRSAGGRLGPERRALPAPLRLLERLRRHVPLPAGASAPASTPVPAARERCGVLVVGAGLAGLAAAAAAAAAGLDVRVVEASPRIGGLADLYDGTIDGCAPQAWALDRAGDLRDLAGDLARDLAPGAIRLRATAIAVDADGCVTVVERPDPARPGRIAVRLFLADAVVLACGFRERPLVFAGNDRPGVLLAGAARALLRRHAVAPGARVVVATCGDEGYRTAIDLKDAGVAVELLLDVRDNPRGPAIDAAKAAGVPLGLSSVVTGVDFSDGEGRILGVFAANLRGDGAAAGARRLFADALVVSGGLVARDELWRSAELGEDRGVFVAGVGPDAAEAVAGGLAAGLAAAAFAGAAADVRVTAPQVHIPADEAGAGPKAYLARVGADGAATAFVDFGADATLADMGDAIARGVSGPRAMARHLGLGRGPDGGRLSADLASHAYAALTGAAGAFAAPPAARPTLGVLAARAQAAAADG